MTGSVHQTRSPTYGQLFTTSRTMKQSWRNDWETWGRRQRTGTTTSGPSRTSPSARLLKYFLQSVFLGSGTGLWKLVYLSEVSFVGGVKSQSMWRVRWVLSKNREHSVERERSMHSAAFNSWDGNWQRYSGGINSIPCFIYTFSHVLW